MTTNEAVNTFTEMVKSISDQIDTAEAMVNIMELAGDDVTDDKKELEVLKAERDRYKNALNAHINGKKEGE